MMQTRNRRLLRSPIIGAEFVTIPLTRGKVAIVDLLDAEVGYYNWHTMDVGRGTPYAVRRQRHGARDLGWHDRERAEDDVNTFLRPHTPRPTAPTTKDTEIARIAGRVDFDDFDQTCVHGRETLFALIREAYEAGQRDPLPDPIGPSDNHLWSPED